MDHICHITTSAGAVYRSVGVPSDSVGNIAQGLADSGAVISFDTETGGVRLQVIVPAREVVTITVDPPLWVAGRLEKVTEGAVFALDETIDPDASHGRVAHVDAYTARWTPVAFHPGVTRSPASRTTALKTFLAGISPTTPDEVDDAEGIVPEGSRFPMWTPEP